MYKKAVVLVIAFLFAIVSLSYAGFLDKAKSKAKSAGSSVKDKAGSTASKASSSAKKTASKAKSGASNLAGDVVKQGGKKAYESGAIIGNTYGQGEKIVSPVSSKAGKAASSVSKGVSNAGKKVGQEADKAGDKIKKFGH